MLSVIRVKVLKLHPPLEELDTIGLQGMSDDHLSYLLFQEDWNHSDPPGELNLRLLSDLLGIDQRFKLDGYGVPVVQQDVHLGSKRLKVVSDLPLSVAQQPECRSYLLHHYFLEVELEAVG